MPPFRSWLRTLGRPALALALGAASLTAVTAPPASAAPVQISSRYAADPGFNRFGKNYYVYATGGSDSGVLPVFRGASATAGFTQVGNALRAVPASLELFWAPHVVKRGSTYFMFFAAKPKTPAEAKHCIYSAVSSRPDSDFHRVKKLVCGPNADWESIDAATYTTVKGNTYLVWRDGKITSFPIGTYAIRSQRLTFSGSTVRFTNSSRYTLAKVKNATVMEAPDVIRHDGKLYLFVSRDRYDTNAYRTEVWSGATIQSAFSPLTTLMTTEGGFGYGPGGAEVLGKPSNKVFIAYHSWQSSKPTPDSDGGNRVTRIAAVTWVDGVPAVS
jgi:beta-xylosidase